jgi:sterol desaturase/sphingolipid hydroxylase (fatty acid hydroxylase superfamily)
MDASVMEPPLQPPNEEVTPPEGEIQSPALDLLPPPERSKMQTWILRVMAIALIIAGGYFSQEGLGALVILFVLVVPFEKFFPRHKGQKVRRPRLGTDMSYAIASPLMAVAAGAIGLIIAIISLAWIPGFLIRPLVAEIPSAYLPIVAFLLFDMTVYWTHRFYHEIPCLWRFHAVHHSTEHLDWASGFRGHPFDGTLAAPAFVFLLAAGFDPELTGILAILQIFLGLFLHANVNWKMKPLHKLVITPEFHHWHHTNETDAHNSNYSTFLPIWDLIFGTYFMPKNRRPQKYGIDEYMPEGIIAQLRYPLRGMKNPFWYIRHPWLSFKGGLKFTKEILGEMKRSAFRPRNRPRS